MKRQLSTVLLEALFIGVLLHVLVLGITKKLYKGKWVLVLAGALIHLLFEYSPFGNINEKWCKMIFN
jgi:membrane-bound ClpP family serine protease